MADLLVRCYRAAHARRLELGLAITVTVGRTVLAHWSGLAPAQFLMLAVITATFTTPQTRAWMTRHLGAAARRRRWERALEGVSPPPATPQVTGTGTDRLSWWAVIRVAGGSTVTDLAGRSEAIAAWLGAAEARVERHPTNAGIGRVRALWADPLTADVGPWPGLASARTSLWAPVPVGVDENGAPVAINLVEHNLLLGGEPGSGKSVALSQLVAAAALDPGTRLWLLDPKLVELAIWRPAADGFAGNDLAEATNLLRQLQQVMDDRYHQLLDAGLRKLPTGSELHVVVVDELAHYATIGDKKARDAFNDTLRDLVARGRAAGVIVLAATQKPGSDIIPTSLRDLFGYRWALRCTTSAASDTVLGAGWATQGASAATIAAANRGVGWLLHESGTPIRLRAHHLSDDHLRQLAQRAANLPRPRGSETTP